MTATTSNSFNEIERLDIQRAYRLLLKSIKTPVTAEDSKNIRRAYEMAVDAHSVQRRKSGEPYILHPIAVARICAEEIGLGPTAIVAALLHDVVEDTHIKLPQIKEEFGEKIAVIVDGLTKLDETENIESPQAENFKKILGTLIQDVRIVLIKMADRMHNMRTLGSMPQHKQLKIAAETEYMYAPLAHRLGLYNFRSEFLDLCLKITHRDEFDDIAQKLNETKRERNLYIQEFIKPLTEQLNETGVEYRISGRSKSIYSIWNKIKGKQSTFEEIYDLFAIRIIVDVPLNNEKGACWQVYSIVTSVHTPLPERLKDWITIPKSNGYESLHTTVIGPAGRYVEVQIRSERMDEVAERGYAAHWKYKSVRRQQDVFESWLDSVRDMVEKANNDSSIDFIQDFKTTNLFTEEVYIYTPKGDLKILPKGATALDFAFNIHTDVGYHCQAVKVNNRLVPMGYKLQSGDQVTVMTNKNQKPNEAWLKWVVTGKARDKIRHGLREEERALAEFGKEALQRKLDHMKVDYETSVELLVKHFNFKSRQEFYAAITNEAIDLQDDLKAFKVEKGKIILIEDEKEAPLSKNSEISAPKPITPKSSLKTQLFIGGQPASMYEHQYAECCKPVQGDDVFAFVSPNGMKIHRVSCKNAENLMTFYGYRVLKADWGATSSATFDAELLITGIDNGPGMIERLSNKISTEIGINIRSFSIEGNEGYFEGRIKVTVANKDQLVSAITALRELDGVSNVSRAD
jgi:GTP diphosphokinase / guanosine-3',5'-bis(diphosphate) 3'-diphosphatase